MNNIFYFIGGIAFLAFGTYTLVKQINIFRRGKGDQLGGDIKILFAGIFAIMIGIAMIAKVF